MTDLRGRYAEHLDRVGDLMLAELTEWAWDELGRLGAIIEDQVRRGGKRLRPLVAFVFAELHGADVDRVVAAATSVEFYHLAALVLDDVQDNSAVRRGARAVHTTSSVSTAINVAAAIRSLSYHPIHRAESLKPAEKLGLHRELDEAATRLVLGQSIDIGWHEGWYRSHLEFPYERMLRWKTGSLFGCASAMGALVGGAGPASIDSARDRGTELGLLFQLVDDYLDVFGDEDALLRPKFEDLRAGKLSGPVVYLLRALHPAGQEVVRRLAHRTSGWEWLLTLLRESGIDRAMRDEVLAIADRLSAYSVDGSVVQPVGVRDLVDLMVAPVRKAL